MGHYKHAFMLLDFFEHSSKPPTSIDGEEFLDKLSNYQLLKQDCILSS